MKKPKKKACDGPCKNDETVKKLCAGESEETNQPGEKSDSTTKKTTTKKPGEKSETTQNKASVKQKASFNSPASSPQNTKKLLGQMFATPGEQRRLMKVSHTMTEAQLKELNINIDQLSARFAIKEERKKLTENINQVLKDNRIDVVDILDVKGTKNDKTVTVELEVKVNIFKAFSFFNAGMKRAIAAGGEVKENLLAVQANIFNPGSAEMPTVEKLIEMMLFLAETKKSSRRLQPAVLLEPALGQLQAAARQLSGTSVDMYFDISPAPGSNVALDKILKAVKTVKKDTLAKAINDVLKENGLNPVEVAALAEPEISSTEVVDSAMQGGILPVLFLLSGIFLGLD